MPRIVLSDPESDPELDRESDESENESHSESESQSDEEEIVYESEEEDIDKLDRELAKKEPPRRARKRKRKHKHKEYSSDESRDDDESDESDDDDDDGGINSGYLNWEAMRAMYAEKGDDGEEPAGYHEHPELHSWGWKLDKPVWSRADKDALWKRITDKTSDRAFRDQWGIRAIERENAGTIERVVERFKYGVEFEDDYKDALTGNYRDAFFRVMEEIFEQEPYQGPPDEGKLPEPRFLDFKWAYVSDDPIGMENQVNRRGTHPHGPFWCFCCQCTKKTLYKVTIARHIPSGIMVVTGGDCSEKFLGEDELPYNLQQHEHVGRLLGWSQPQ